MKARAASLLPLALMLLLAGLTLWLQYLVSEGSGGVAKPAAHEPDAIVENFTVQRLDDSGKLLYTFSSPRMAHYADDGSGEALYPRVVQLRRDGGDIIATANRGTINRQGEEAFLYGNVEVVREATRQEPEFRARTEFLHVLAEKGISRTDRSVIITEGRSTLTGVGLVVDKERRQFTLQSQVRGVFDAPNRK
jgi:lipopolysaccharide export system protein LptC